MRADHTSAYGYPLPTTPFLEAVANEGVRVERAYAPMPTTLPSHATMLTSKPPIVHGFMNRIEPWVLGMPFLYAWLLGVYVLSIAVLIWAYRKGL